jgi:hypothetical protein
MIGALAERPHFIVGVDKNIPATQAQELSESNTAPATPDTIASLKLRRFIFRSLVF